MAHYAANPSILKASNFEFGIVGGLSISQALMVSPIVTAVRKSIGPRWTLLIGSVLIFISLLTSSFATQLWHLLLSQGFCFGWGMGFCYVTAAAVLPAWFSTKRSLAVGYATAGAGIGGLIYSIVTSKIIEALDVAWAYRILAFCALGANLLAAVLIRDFNTKAHQLPSDSRFDPRDFGRVEVLLIVLWGFSTELGYIILLYSLPTYAASIGLTPSQGAVANALLNLGLAIGRPPVGYVSDAFGRINMAGVMTFLCAIFCFGLWIPAQSYAPLLAFALISGMLCGTFWCTVTPVLAEVVGIKKLASTFGAICIGLVLPTTFAEPVAMKMVSGHSSGDFINAQIFAGCMFLVGSLSLWMLRCWKIFNGLEETEGLNTIGKKYKYWVNWLTPRMLFNMERV